MRVRAKAAMSSEQYTHTRVSRRSPFRLLCKWVLLPLCLLLLVPLILVYLLCVFRPDVIASGVQREMIEATGLPWRIQGAILPELFPYPGLSIADVRLLAATPEQAANSDPDRPLMQVGRLHLYIDPASLSSFSLRFHRVELEDPVVNLAYDANKHPLWIAPADPLPGQTHGQGELGADSGANPGANLGADRGQGDAATHMERAATMVCTLPPFALQPLTIRNGSLISFDPDGNLLLSFTGIEGRFTPDAPADNLSLSSTFSLPAADLDVSVDLTARVGCDGVPAKGAFTGRVQMTPPGSRTITGDFASSFTWSATGKDILLPDFRMLAESDTLTADLLVDLAVPECRGKVHIHRLSLPRWFEFGRVLPPGLRQTLHTLIGDFDLQLDAGRAEARNLRGVVGPLAVHGFVGTPDFSAPVVVVDLDADSANLDLIFPFLAAVGTFVPDPTPPVFDHPPLAPYPQAADAPPPLPDAPPGVEVGYDVRVRVARPSVHDVTAGPLEVLVYPVTVQKKDKTRVTFAVPAIIGGSINGRLDIDEKTILMHYDVKKLELGQLPENAQNIVRIAGQVTGICEIDVPMDKNGDLADNWALRVNAGINGCTINGLYPAAPWKLHAGKLTANGTGNIHTVRSKGIRIEGLWDLDLRNINTSWHPKGNDAITAKFNGGLHWPPIADAPPPAPGKVPLMQKRGVDKVAGNFTAQGSLIVPLGSFLAPVTGKLQSDLDWRLYGDTLALDNLSFEGFGSYTTGKVHINFSGPEVVIGSEVSGKFNPAQILKGWGISLPGGMQAPRLLTGRTTITGKSRSLAFDPLKVEMDGAPVTGSIAWKAGAKTSDPGDWTFRLTADHLNLNTLFPPSEPGAAPRPSTTTPWRLKGLAGLGLDAQITARNVKWDTLSFAKTKLTAALQRDRFSLHTEIGSFYTGTGTLLFQGSIVPDKSQVTLRKGLVQMQQVSLGKLLYDYTGDRSYAGTADLVVDLTGNMSSNADMPGALSGVWDVRIKDGLYPAFIGGESSNLRNTFSSASLSGVLDKGVLRSDNFRLTGPMVDMSGGGWMNLNNRSYDFNLSATFAKVPTVPVRFYGSAGTSHMQVRGVDMVVETMQNAGSTVFGLIRGVLELPAHAVRGISSLFEKDKEETAPAKPVPVKIQTGHPGQAIRKK